MKIINWERKGNFKLPVHLGNTVYIYNKLTWCNTTWTKKAPCWKRV